MSPESDNIFNYNVKDIIIDNVVNDLFEYDVFILHSELEDYFMSNCISYTTELWT
jgi:hypothetical protein